MRRVSWNRPWPRTDSTSNRWRGCSKGASEGRRSSRGKADESLLFKMAAHRVEPVMPPKDKPANKPLELRGAGPA